MAIDYPGEKFLTKLLEAFERAGSALGRPGQIKREGRARAEAQRATLLLAERTRQDLVEVRAGRKSLDATGKLIPGPTTPTQQLPKPAEATEPHHSPEEINRLVDDFRRRHAQEAVLQAMEKSITLDEVKVYAEQEGEKVTDPEVSEEPVDPDWFARWRQSAEIATSEDLKRLWARILANEVRQPGCFSLRTLEFVKGISKADAKLIEKIGPFRIGGSSIYVENAANPLVKYGISFDELLLLDEMGIVSITQIRLTYNSIKTLTFENVPQCNEKVLLISGEDKDKKIDITVMKISKIGQELLSLNVHKANLDYLADFASCMKKSGLDVKIGNIIKRNKDGLILHGPLKDFP